MKRSFVILAVAAGAGAVVFAVGRSPRSPEPASVSVPRAAPVGAERARHSVAPTATPPLRRAPPRTNCQAPGAAASSGGGGGEAVTRPPTDFSESLKPAPAWTGARPASLAEVEPTPSIRARVQEYGGPSAVNQTLEFLSEMKGCLSGHQVDRPGGLILHLSYKVDYDSWTMTGDDVVPDQSALSEADDRQVIECARKFHVGKSHKIGPETKDALQGAKEYEWRTILDLPVDNDRFYAWLLTDPPVTATQ
jgi:hypothetical protein